MWPFLAIVCKSYQFPASFKSSQIASLANNGLGQNTMKKNPFELLVMKKRCKKVFIPSVGQAMPF